MPGPQTAKPIVIRRRLASAVLLTLAFASLPAPGPATAGPIGDHFREWSARRQARAQVEMPFSKQSSSVNLAESSVLKKLRSRLTGKSGEGAGSHVMKTDYLKHERGMLQR